MSNTVNNYTETDLGNISLNPRGEYDSSVEYEYLDTVSYQGGSYFCLAELETTITGIAPDSGHNSEHWQMIAAPGDMTPEYTAAYNDVIKKAVQVETSRAAVELAQQEIEAVQTDVQQLHSDTVQAAQEAENSKNSAANSAQSAEQSRKTVSESEQNINGQIAGFDSRVSEAVEQSKEEINTTKQQAIDTITNQQNTSVNAVKTEGEKIITRVGNDAKTVANDRATVEEAVQTVLNNAQEVAQNTQTVASNTENAVASAESAKTSADNAAQSAKGVEDASKQIEQNKKDVASLKEDISTKITKFYASSQGEIHLADSDNGKIMDMMIYGKSSQDGTPTPENPVEIKSVVNPTVKVRGKNLFGGKAFIDKIVELGGTLDEANKTVTISGAAIDEKTLFEFPDSSKQYTIILSGTNTNASIQSTNLKGNISGSLKYFQNGISVTTLSSDNETLVGTYETASAIYNYDQCGIFEGVLTYDDYEPYHEQTVTLPYTLNAIPVSSGGNVTIDGQQYVSDRVVEKGGVFGIERNIREIHANTKTMNNSDEYPGWNKVKGISDITYYNEALTGQSRKLFYVSNFTKNNIFQNNYNNNIVYYIKNSIGYSQSELIAKAIDIDMYIRLQDAIFEPLPEDIQVKLQTLATNYPVTNISVTSDQLNGYTIFNYPISMENGWNYVKKQLNDNRDYIYDMDVQSAEAYVNSEYAVALTELEV